MRPPPHAQLWSGVPGRVYGDLSHTTLGKGPPCPRPRSSVASPHLLAAVLVAVLAPAGAGQAAAPSYVALGDSYSSGTGTRTYLADGSGCLRSVYAYPSLIAAARGYSPRLPRLLGRHDRRRHRRPAGRGHPGDELRDDLGRRQRRRLRGRAHRVRAAGLAQQLRRCDQRRAELHQHHAARRAEHAVRRHPRSRAERSGRGGRLPADLQRARTATPAPGSHRPRRPGSTPPPTCSTPGSRPRPPPRASASPTRPRRSSGTPSATTSSGSTGCPGRSSSPTTPTAPGRPPATRRR